MNEEEGDGGERRERKRDKKESGEREEIGGK